MAAGFLGGLLGGGGDDYDLYGDLLTDKQKSAIRSREMTQGLLRMSGAFAEAAKPSLLPTGGIGSALGRGAAALAGGEDGGEKALQGLLTGEKIRQAQQERELYKRFGPAIEKIAWKLIGGQTVMAPPGQPPAPGAQPVTPVPTTGPGAQQTISATAADAAIPADDAPMLPGAPPLNAIGVPLPQDLRRFGLPARPTPAGAAPAVDRYGMPALPGYEFVPGGGMRALPQGAQQQQTGVLPQIASLYEGGSPEGSDPFGDGAPGAAGGGLLLDPERRVDVRPLSGQAAPASGAPSRDDPRGLIPYIRQQAIARGIDPDVAVRVAQSEGLGSFQSSVIQKSGRREPSFGAFQLYTGGGMGNEFQRDTGLDPSDPRNEKATIDYALDNVTRTGWTPWHGARGAGIGPRTGLPGGQQYSASSTLPDTGRVDVRPLSGAAVPAGAAAPGGAPGGKIPGTDVSPQELAALSMMLKMSGIKGSPFDALLETYYKSPEYLGEAETARTKARTAIEDPLNQRMEILKFNLQMRKDGFIVGDDGKVTEDPEWAKIHTRRNDETESLKAKYQEQVQVRIKDHEEKITIKQEQRADAREIVQAPIYGPDGRIVMQEMPRGEKVERLKNQTMSPGGYKPGDIIAKPVGDPPAEHQWQMTPQGELKAVPVPGSPAATKAAEVTRTQEMADRTLLRARDIMNEDTARVEQAMKSSWLPVTGFWGVLLGSMPNTPQNDVRVTIDAIKARTSLDSINATRAATGSTGLGQITMGEHGMLASAVAALDRSQTKEAFLVNLRRVNAEYNNLISSPAFRGTIPKETVVVPPAPPGGLPPGYTDTGRRYQGKPVVRGPDGKEGTMKD